MKASTDARLAIAQKIADGTYTKKAAERAMNALQREYPEDAFGQYYHFVRKPKPWDRAYLEELKNLCYSGADTREFMSFMAEVSDEIYHAGRIRKMVLAVLLCAAVLACIVLISKSFLR